LFELAAVVVAAVASTETTGVDLNVGIAALEDPSSLDHVREAGDRTFFRDGVAVEGVGPEVGTDREDHGVLLVRPSVRRQEHVGVQHRAVSRREPDLFPGCTLRDGRGLGRSDDGEPGHDG
jgi:hypothetical protein